MKQKVEVLEYYSGEGKVAGQVSGFIVPFERCAVTTMVVKRGEIIPKTQHMYNCLCLLCSTEKLLTTKQISQVQSCGCLVTKEGKAKAAELRPTLVNFQKKKKVTKTS